MQSITRGWGFLKQAWQMAMADKDLLKPSIYALVAGIVVTIIPVIPIGVTLGILLATPFIMVATIIATYTSTAYHTCLYLWARDVEQARLSGQVGEIRAPSPLSAVL